MSFRAFDSGLVEFDSGPTWIDMSREIVMEEVFTKNRALLHVPERFQNITQKVLVSGRLNLLTFLLKLFEEETKSSSNVL